MGTRHTQIWALWSRFLYLVYKPFTVYFCPAYWGHMHS